MQDETADELAYEWLTWHRDTAHSAENTYKKYAGIMIDYLAYCSTRKIDPMAPTLTELERYVKRGRKALNGRMGKAATQQLDVKVLRGFYTWLAQRHHIVRSPALELRGPKMRDRNPRPILDEHWQIIWGHDLSDRLRAVLGFGYFAGLRVAELQSLTCDQITPTRLTNFTRKGGGEQTLPWHDMARTVNLRLPHLLPDLQVLVRAANHTRINYYELSPYSGERALYEAFTKLCRDVLHIPKYTPHQLRHSTATNLFNARIPSHMVMALMNHKSIDTTMGYVRANPTDLGNLLDGT